MVLDTTQSVFGPDGKPFMRLIDGKEEPWILGDIIVHALGNAPVLEKTLIKMLERWDLAKKFQFSNCEISIAEAKLIQDCMLVTFQSFVVASVSIILEDNASGLDEGKKEVKEDIKEEMVEQAKEDLKKVNGE